MRGWLFAGTHPLLRLCGSNIAKKCDARRLAESISARTYPEYEGVSGVAEVVVVRVCRAIWRHRENDDEGIAASYRMRDAASALFYAEYVYRFSERKSRELP